MPETMPGYIPVPCPTCGNSGTIWDDGVPLLQSVITGEPMRAGAEVDCPECEGDGRSGWRWIGDPALLDTSSSASRQHYIDTGRYLTHAQVAEYADTPRR